MILKKKSTIFILKNTKTMKCYKLKLLMKPKFNYYFYSYN